MSVREEARSRAILPVWLSESWLIEVGRRGSVVASPIILFMILGTSSMPDCDWRKASPSEMQSMAQSCVPLLDVGTADGRRGFLCEATLAMFSLADTCDR